MRGYDHRGLGGHRHRGHRLGSSRSAAGRLPSSSGWASAPWLISARSSHPSPTSQRSIIHHRGCQAGNGIAVGRHQPIAVSSRRSVAVGGGRRSSRSASGVGQASRSVVVGPSRSAVGGHRGQRHRRTVAAGRSLSRSAAVGSSRSAASNGFHIVSRSSTSYNVVIGAVRRSSASVLAFVSRVRATLLGATHVASTVGARARDVVRS